MSVMSTVFSWHGGRDEASDHRQDLLTAEQEGFSNNTNTLPPATFQVSLPNANRIPRLCCITDRLRGKVNNAGASL